MNRFITTTIPYVNAAPHLGHALELVQTDIAARFHRLCGIDVHLQTGTDENAFKNVIAAQKAHVDPHRFVEINSNRFRDLAAKLDVSAGSFVRTSSAYHREITERFWKKIQPDDLFQHDYEGLYCQGCEEFLTETDLENGNCPDHGYPPEHVTERNWFFRLSSYSKAIANRIERDEIRVVPAAKKNEILSFIRRGLADICVSRDARRSGNWGILVPEDPSQVIYVWIDALINYISGQRDGSDCFDTWNSHSEVIHVLGKNVWKFHAIYWPALLLSAGLRLPDTLFIHGFITSEGKKISKSVGNPVDPSHYIQTFGSDAVRWYFASQVSPYVDGDFSDRRFIGEYDSALASGVGNFANRVLTLCSRAAIPGIDPSGISEGLLDSYRPFIESFAFNKYTRAITEVLTSLNVSLQKESPWKFAEDKARYRSRLCHWRDRLAEFAVIIAPVLTQASEKLTAALSGERIERISPLYPRMDVH